MPKVTLKEGEGYRWVDKETGWKIARGEVKEAPDEVVARAGRHLRVLLHAASPSGEDDDVDVGGVGSGVSKDK